MKPKYLRLPKTFPTAACFAILILLASLSTAFAAPITGIVMNLTKKKPAVGDTVALIRLAQGMQIEAHAITDSRGHYTLDVPDGDQVHLIRVTHDKANYFQPAPPGTQTVNVNVYDAAEKVEGVSTEADVQRISTDQNGLRVIESYFVKNVSSPPRTQFGPRAYEIYLPKEAQIVSAAALGPGSMPVQSAPVPLGEPGHYTFIFPLRPGETHFQVSYRLPYSGNFQFHPRVAAPVDNFAIILPKSMQFKPTPAAAFQPIDEDVNVQTYLAKNITPQGKLAFQVSGTGQLPQETASGQGGENGPNGNAQPAGESPAAAAQAAAVNNTRPGIGLGVPIDTPDPLHKYKWWIISLVVILLAVGAGVSMKRTTPPVSVVTASGASYPIPSQGALPGSSPGASVAARSSIATPSSLLDVLKEELFALETERLEGRLAPEEYERQKAALEIVLKRALDRNGSKAAPA